MSDEQVNLEELEKEVIKLQQSNIEKVKSLAQLGKGLDAAFLADLKIDTFVRTFLNRGQQLAYVRNLETALRHELDEVLKTVRQEQLTQGVPRVNSLHIPR